MNAWDRRPLVGPRPVLVGSPRVVVQGEEACLIVRDERGRIRLLPTLPARHDDLAEALALAAKIAGARVAYAQLALSSPALEHALQDAGLRRVGDRLGLGRPLPLPGPCPWPDGLRVRCSLEEAELADALSATWDPETDWPELGQTDPAQIVRELRPAPGDLLQPWVLRRQGEVAAAIWLQTVAGVPEAWVAWIGVAPAERRRGLARSVLAAALTRLPAHLIRVRAVADARNPSCALFARLGFQEQWREALWVHEAGA
jgi:ribosomal protein S18 acetylase RimI-like enzyme